VAAAYEREVKRVLGEAPHFDLILLGVGEDGHTASLFPHSPALASPRLVAAAVSPLPPLRRVTFTPALITAAARALVLATGGEKAEAVRRALEEPPSPAVPASLLRGGNVLWHLDQAAARLLQRPHQPTSAG
jgi:6-phosphogluconolactonase